MSLQLANSFSDHISLTPDIDISGTSESSSFRSLLEAAAEEYEKQVGTSLIGHPLAVRLRTCESVESVTAVLEEQAQAFRKFRGDDGKVMKALKRAVQFLHTLSTSAVLSEGIALIVRSAGLTDTVFLVTDPYLEAVPTREVYTRWHCYPPRSRRLLPFLQCPCDI